MEAIFQEFINYKQLSINTIHGNNILAKIKNYDSLTDIQKSALKLIIPEYKKFIDSNLIIGYNEFTAKIRVEALNNYYNFLDYSFSDGIDKIFTSRGKFRPSVIEEFMYFIFRDLVNEKVNKLNSENLKIGSIKAYSNLYFTAENLEELLNMPTIRFNEKDQDFAIYSDISLKIGNNNINTKLPIISIENKTYLDKTMLEGSIATAEKIKNGNPHSLFFIVAENYDVDLKVDPSYSRIDQIYVLRKSKRSKTNNLPIYSDVVIDLINCVNYHLERNWSDIKNKLSNFGKII